MTQDEGQQLVAAIDSLVSWVTEHQNTGVDAAGEAELANRDALVYALAENLEFRIPVASPGAHCVAYGLTGVPHHTGSKGLTVHATPSWRQSMNGLRARAILASATAKESLLTETQQLALKILRAANEPLNQNEILSFAQGMDKPLGESTLKAALQVLASHRLIEAVKQGRNTVYRSV